MVDRNRTQAFHCRGYTFDLSYLSPKKDFRNTHCNEAIFGYLGPRTPLVRNSGHDAVSKRCWAGFPTQTAQDYLLCPCELTATGIREKVNRYGTKTKIFAYPLLPYHGEKVRRF
jgi:hypothetical protein